ncbi:hypothetical protein V2K77_01730 [Pseudomonas alliivorans]|nr:hypothetical protein [Pseudomonas alliivorans]MEE4710219.1 hypothetical protein [Pseudomonas alliivorans]MEE4725174.1 hypothetical protein [Pseudomonas alliivorans]MEE4765965.1 hypothetical protein [Pseudomonas alliivorans]
MTNKPNSGTVSVSRELLPCPFCGSSDVKIVTDDGIHFAQCCKCEATGPTGFKRGEENDADWNNRAQPSDQQGEPVRLTAVAVLHDDGDGGLQPEWLLEGGTAELWDGALLLVAGEDPDLCEEDGSAELYRHAQPATAKVVLPERMPGISHTDSYEEGWNACLDEVAKLNNIGEKP